MQLTGLECRRRRVGVSGLGSTWATEGSEFSFKYAESKLERRETEKEVSNGQLEIYMWREKEGNLDVKKKAIRKHPLRMKSEATVDDQIRPPRGSI